MLLFLLLFYPRNPPLKFGQNGVSDIWIVGVDVVVVVIFVVDPKNPPLKFGWNWVRNSWGIGIDDIEFVVVVVGGSGGGGVKSFSCQTQLLRWVEVELGLLQ